MSKDLNRCMFIGRLGNDPEVRSMPNGTTVTNISLAVGGDYKDKQGNKVERTEWIRCTAFGKLADLLAEYTRKGSKIYAEGEWRGEKYEKDGTTVYATKLQMSEVQFLDSKPQDSAPAQPAKQHKPSQQQPADDGFGDSDIPF